METNNITKATFATFENDMEVARKWSRRGLEVIRSGPEVQLGGVAGYLCISYLDFTLK